MSKNKIIWEKWVDPFFLENITDKKDDDEVEEDFPSYDEYSQQEEAEDVDESVLLLYSDMGGIPYNEKQPSGKIFNFWIGHTNFDITHNVKETIEAVDGIEILDVFTRYRFRIAIGKSFTDREVMNNISKALSNKSS